MADRASGLTRIWWKPHSPGRRAAGLPLDDRRFYRAQAAHTACAVKSTSGNCRYNYMFFFRARITLDSTLSATYTYIYIYTYIYVYIYIYICIFFCAPTSTRHQNWHFLITFGPLAPRLSAALLTQMEYNARFSARVRRRPSADAPFVWETQQKHRVRPDRMLSESATFGVGY